MAVPACNRAWLRQGHQAPAKQEISTTRHSSTFDRSGTYFFVLTTVVTWLFTHCNYRRTPISADSVSVVYRSPEKCGKLKKYTVRKFHNVRQMRTGQNMVKSSSPNTPSTWLIFLCPRTHASPQTCHHSASSVLAVRISCRVIAVFVFRKQQEWRTRWIPTIG